ncbi:hypothetical protein F4805DRAFT_392046 [Annulohypoxylon moriforme]|nr:hypothetical protein F4805DRAFT_392046 [Annulohypoxylon moriforme]
MDPASAIGVAAAAVQFVEITIKITKRIAVFAVLRDVPEDAEGPKAFVERLRSQLGLLNATIRRIEGGLMSSDESLQDNELLELRNYISNLNRHGQKLDGLLNKYLPNDDTSVPSRLLAALKSIASDAQIKSVMDSVNDLLPLLTTFLLTSIFTRGSLTFNQSGNIGADVRHRPTQPNSSAIYQVTRNEARHFIDRPELSTEIDRIFSRQQTKTPKIVILQGMGGQGKTQLALRYCGKARLKNKFQYILWVDASTRASTLRGLEEISESLHNCNQTLVDSDARVAFVKRELTATHLSWLLIFDNYDNPTDFDLREYIPKGPLGHILITSRNENLERIGPVMRLSGMAEGEAIRLLFTLLGLPENDRNRTAAADIVRRLGYLPLAIDQAGAYMKAECIPLPNFLDYYEKSARDILESVPNSWEYYEPTTSQIKEGVTNTMAKSVFTTWNLSFKLLKPDTPAGAMKVDILSLLAFFDGHAISEEFFEVYYSSNELGQQPEWMSLFTDEERRWSRKQFDGVMREFLQLSLITSLNTKRADTKYAFVSLHPLVRDWINLRQEKRIHRTNFTTFTRILAAKLSETLWEDSVLTWGFRISTDQRRQLAEHVALWMDAFKQHKPDLRPTIICTEYKRDLTTITAEQLIAKFLLDIDQHKNNDELLNWLWEYCDISDPLMLRVKFDVGNQQVRSLLPSDEARNKSRENLQYWKAVLSANSLRDYMLHESHLVFLMTLTQSAHIEDKRLCIDACKAELERLPNDEKNMSLRHRLFAEMLYAAYFCRQKDLYKRICGIMLEETEKYGGDDYRKKIWSYRVWNAVVKVAIDAFQSTDLAGRLSLIALEWANEKYGRNQTYIVQFHISRADVLLKMGRFVEAETMIRDCIATGEVNRDLLSRIHHTLGNIFKYQRKFEEAYEAYNLALLQVQGPDVRADALYLLECCGNVAKQFNLGLADSHYKLLLSLAKKIKNWATVTRIVMELYFVKSYTRSYAAPQEALELLIYALSVYGIQFIYKKDYRPARPLRDIHTVIHLYKLESLQFSIKNEMVHSSLRENFGVLHCYGLDLLIWLAVTLLWTKNTNAAEHAFHLAKVAFDRRTDIDGYSVTRFVTGVYRYTRLRFEVDKDRKRVRDILSWGRILIHKRFEGGMKRYEDWWERQEESLLDLIENHIQVAMRKRSKSVREMTNGLKRLGVKHFDSFLHSSSLDEEVPSYNIASLPVGSTTYRTRNGPVASTSRS